MEDVGALLASLILHQEDSRGSILLLDGDLGAGKSTFSRGFVHQAAANYDQKVTSPTYLLSNTYPVAERRDLEVHHIDLYRLSGKPEALVPLNLNYVFAQCIALVEWPRRMPEYPPERLDVRITIPTGNGTIKLEDEDEDRLRRVTMTAHGARWNDILESITQEGLLEDLMAQS